MKYDFSEQQVQNLKAIINDANIKGGMAPMIVELLVALSTPLEENNPKKATMDIYEEPKQ